jgi:hypothetical protein
MRWSVTSSTRFSAGTTGGNHMHEKRIRNIFLAIVAGLLLLNLGVMLSPATHAIPKTQYKVVALQVNKFDNPNVVELALNQQSAEGWVYVGEAGGVLIFKK